MAIRASSKVCAIHAGWRGTAKKIVAKAISRLVELGSSQADLRIAIGPAIAGSVYQVDDYVAVEVGNTIVEESQSDADLLDTLKQMPNPPILDDELPGKVRLDVPRVNYIQLTQLNISPEQIANSRPTVLINKVIYSFPIGAREKKRFNGQELSLKVD